jgi:hypothetical protein
MVNDRLAAGAVIGGQPPNSRWWHGAVTAAPDGLTAQMTGVEGAADVQPGRTQLSTTAQGGISEYRADAFDPLLSFEAKGS